MGSIATDTPILVLDDSPAIRARMGSYLKRLGYEHIHEAANVQEGLQQFRENPIRLVFLDLVVESERGADFAAAALEERPMTDIIVMTALPPTHEQVTVAIAQGARGMIRKPVDLDAVKNALDALEDTEEPNPPAAARAHDASYG